MTTTTVPVQTTQVCDGCIGRGCGTACGICGGTIPNHLRRTTDSPREYRSTCTACLVGARHTHRQG